MKLKKIYSLLLFFGVLTSSWAQSLEDYPWLNDVLEEDNCCMNKTVTAYDFGNYSFVYIAPDESCSSINGKLYFEDGQCWCTEGNSLSCLSSYGLDSSQGINLFTCEGESNFDIFDEFPWLSSVVNRETQEVQLIDLGAYKFLYVIDCNGTTGHLYYETGQFYCMDAPNYDCLLAYGFMPSSITSAISCEGMDTDCTTLIWYQDVDGDGLGNLTVSQQACDQPDGYVADNTDDNDACNGVVDVCLVCNGSGPTTWYEDVDGDGLGNPAVNQEACDQPDGYVADNTDDNDAGTTGTPLSAFDEFNPDAVTISFDGDEITIESNGQPNHTSPYYEVDNPLYIEPVVAIRQTPGFIRERSFTVTVPAAPELAETSSATGLGPIGISVTGAPIFNDTEGPNRPLEEQIAQTFDYAGAHNGPSGYHYHVESFDVPENDGVLSHDDNKLVGIMADGFLIYGRKEMDGSYPDDLDESGGHFGVTPHSDGIEIYHYHIINEFYLGNLVVLFGGDLQGTPSSIQ